MTDGIITEKRDLRTGKSVWLDAAGVAVRCRAGVPRRADIVIVGAGISGAMLAYRLRRHGANLLVLDRREPLAPRCRPGCGSISSGRRPTPTSICG